MLEQMVGNPVPASGREQGHGHGEHHSIGTNVRRRYLGPTMRSYVRNLFSKALNKEQGMTVAPERKLHPLGMPRQMLDDIRSTCISRGANERQLRLGHVRCEAKQDEWSGWRCAAGRQGRGGGTDERAGGIGVGGGKNGRHRRY